MATKPVTALILVLLLIGASVADVPTKPGGELNGKPYVNPFEIVNGVFNLTNVVGGLSAIGNATNATTAIGNITLGQGTATPPPQSSTPPTPLPPALSGDPAGGPGFAPAIGPDAASEDDYLFGVYQTTGTGLGASVYTGNRTVQYTGVRNPDGSPANLTDLSYIEFGARTDIMVNMPLGSAATLSNTNGSLVVGLPFTNGSDITVGYTLSDYTTGNIIMFNTSVPANKYESTAGQGRRLLQENPCSQIADTAASFCQAIALPRDVSITVISNYAQGVRQFIQDQLSAFRAGTIVYVGAYAGAEGAALASAAASIATVGAEIYFSLTIACQVRSAASAALNYANLHPCSPQQGGCDDNGADDSC